MTQPIHTPGPVDLLWEVEGHDPDSIILRSTHNGLNMGICEVFESKANAQLLRAAYNAFDSGAKKLNLNAVELAERMSESGIAELVEALQELKIASCGVAGCLEDDAPSLFTKFEKVLERASAILAKVKGGAA